MTNIQELNDLLHTRSTQFNNMALKLYLENLKTNLFPDPAVPLALLKYVHDLVGTHGGYFFSFVTAFLDHMAIQQLSSEQGTFIRRFLKSYANAMSQQHNNQDTYHIFRDLYKPYFTTLVEMDTENSIRQAIETGEAGKKVHAAIQREMLVLSDEMDRQPAETRIKTLAALVRITAQYEKMLQANEPKPAKETVKKSNVVPLGAPVNPTQAEAVNPDGQNHSHISDPTDIAMPPATAVFTSTTSVIARPAPSPVEATLRQPKLAGAGL